MSQGKTPRRCPGGELRAFRARIGLVSRRGHILGGFGYGIRASRARFRIVPSGGHALGGRSYGLRVVGACYAQGRAMNQPIW